jgi:hypothetical protein
VCIGRVRPMSVLDDFARIRAFRKRASEFDWLADNETDPSVRLRYRTMARHYHELADREEQADKARLAERIERLKLQRQQAAAKAVLPARRQFFLIAAE